MAATAIKTKRKDQEGLYIRTLLNAITVRRNMMMGLARTRININIELKNDSWESMDCIIKNTTNSTVGPHTNKIPTFFFLFSMLQRLDHQYFHSVFSTAM